MALKLAGRDITVKTLLVCDVRELLDELKEQNEAAKEGKFGAFDQHAGDLLIDDEVPMSAVAKSIGWTVDELEGQVDPNELVEVVKEVRKKNPFFVGMMERLIGTGRKVRQAESPSSTE